MEDQDLDHIFSALPYMEKLESLNLEGCTNLNLRMCQYTVARYANTNKVLSASLKQIVFDEDPICCGSNLGYLVKCCPSLEQVSLMGQVEFIPMAEWPMIREQAGDRKIQFLRDERQRP